MRKRLKKWIGAKATAYMPPPGMPRSAVVLVIALCTAFAFALAALAWLMLNVPFGLLGLHVGWMAHLALALVSLNVGIRVARWEQRRSKTRWMRGMRITRVRGKRWLWMLWAIGSAAGAFFDSSLMDGLWQFALAAWVALLTIREWHVGPRLRTLIFVHRLRREPWTGYETTRCARCAGRGWLVTNLGRVIACTCPEGKLSWFDQPRDG